MKAAENETIISWFMPDEEHKKLKLITLDHNSTMTDLLRRYLENGNKTYMDKKIDVTKYDLKKKKNKQVLMTIDKISHNTAKKIALNNGITLKSLLVIYVYEGNKQSLV
ncbi:hypothetical protein [Phascolarctobacterium sp.]